MSKKVDTSDLDSLSKEDLQYLSDRGLLSAEQEAKYDIKPSTRQGGGVPDTEAPTSAFEAEEPAVPKGEDQGRSARGRGRNE